MLCASSVSINPWQRQRFSELGLVSLWGLWDWFHGGGHGHSIPGAPAGAACPVGPLFASSTQPPVIHPWECHKCHPRLFTAPAVMWGSARFKYLP